MSDILRAAEAEERRLLEELRDNMPFQMLRSVQAMLAIYRTKAAAAPCGARAGTGTAEHIEVAANYFRTHRKRASARLILTTMSARSDLPQAEINAFASNLSHSTLFDNIRGRGYGLAEWNGADGPDEVRIVTAS